MFSTTSRSKAVASFASAAVAAACIVAAAASTVVDGLRLGSPANAGGHAITNLPATFATSIGAATTTDLASAHARIDTIEITGASSLNAVLATGNQATTDIVRVYAGWQSVLATVSNAQQVADAAGAIARTNAAVDAAIATIEWAGTGTVFGARHLVQMDGMASAALESGEVVIRRVASDWNRLVTISTPEDLIGSPQYPPAGTVFVATNRWDVQFPYYAPYYESEDGQFAVAGFAGLDSYWHWAFIAAQPGWEEGTHSWWLGQAYVEGTQPAVIDYNDPTNGLPDFVVGPSHSTNAVSVSTPASVAASIAAWAATPLPASLPLLDSATNLVWRFSVSNGHYIATGTTP